MKKPCDNCAKPTRHSDDAGPICKSCSKEIDAKEPLPAETMIAGLGMLFMFAMLAGGAMKGIDLPGTDSSRTNLVDPTTCKDWGKPPS